MKTFQTVPRPEPVALRPCPLCGGRRFAPLWRLEGFAFVRCAGCGLIQQNPQPLVHAVLSRYGEAYLEYEIAHEGEYRDLELLALKDLDFKKRTEALVARASKEGRKPAILDVGCATGALLAGFRDDGWSATGVEANAAEAEWGRKRHGLEILAGTLESAAFPEASFDVIHASHLIEHLNEPLAFLELARSLLRPGGVLVITTPNSSGFQARLLGRRWRSAINDHLYLFSRGGLRELLSLAGFSAEAWSTWGGWAKGQKPAFMKGFLDRAAKRLGCGDVMAVLATKAS
jgi:SAM-dependent methyltransferase